MSPSPATRPARRVPRRFWIVLGALAALLLGASALRGALGVEWSAASVREAVDGFGPWAPLAFVGMLSVRFVFLIPSQVLLTAAGVLFGAVPGALYGAAGLTLAAVLKYVFVQWTGADSMRARLPPRFDGALALSRSRAGVGALALISGYPAGPIAVAHVIAAITGMAFLTFTLAVGAGSLVRAATFSFFGSTLLEGGRLAWGVVVVAAAAGLPLLHPRTRAWIRQGFLREKGGAAVVRERSQPS